MARSYGIRSSPQPSTSTLRTERHVVDISVAGDKAVFEVEGSTSSGRCAAGSRFRSRTFEECAPTRRRAWMVAWASAAGHERPGAPHRRHLPSGRNNVFWDVHDPERTIVI